MLASIEVIDLSVEFNFFLENDRNGEGDLEGWRGLASRWRGMLSKDEVRLGVGLACSSWKWNGDNDRIEGLYPVSVRFWEIVGEETCG